MSDRTLKIALISPKGPLYRHRGGIFGKSLRYMPLTLPTLAALVPSELNAQVVCIDEGIADVDLDLQADIVGMTVITGTARRAYELAGHFRRRGICVVLGGPHVTLVPDDAQPHADSIVVGYAEEEWPRLLRDWTAGRLQPRYVQSPSLDLSNSPFPDRSVLPRGKFLTANVFEATRGCVHNCSFCVVPAAWGRRPLQKPVEQVVADIRRQRARKAIFVDLNLIADQAYAARLFEALIPLRVRWYGLTTTLLCDDTELLDLAARSGCRGLLMGLESISPPGLRETVFLKTARFAVETGIDLPRYAIVTPFPGTALYRELAADGRILTHDWEQYDGQHVVFQPRQMSVAELQHGTEAAWKYTYRFSSIARRLMRTAAPLPLALATNLGYRYYAHNLHRFYTCDVPIDPAEAMYHRLGARRNTAVLGKAASAPTPEAVHG